MFKDGPIEGVFIRSVNKFADERGWLMEVFRNDDLSPELFPVMSYMSMTKPGVARGPHEHRDQTDYFLFAGTSTFKVYMWDNREKSPTHRNRMVVTVGSESPTIVIVPQGVVHAYKNTGFKDGLVINCPNRLFKGVGRKEPVDEIRHEEKADSPFVID